MPQWLRQSDCAAGGTTLETVRLAVRTKDLSGSAEEATDTLSSSRPSPAAEAALLALHETSRRCRASRRLRISSTRSLNTSPHFLGACRRWKLVGYSIIN